MNEQHLSWFLGPKSENANFFMDSIVNIAEDYIYWRRNYHPADKILISRDIQRQHEAEYDRMYLGMAEMMSQLRRNFPFYSPRYIGHMLSDVAMPATLGYLAGLLHNANNVTPEAAPVTVEWEIEACNRILEMVGFKPSPTPPAPDDDIKAWKQYQRRLKGEFGWAHITSGGTVANIEALWVARIVKYFPLGIQEVAQRENLAIEVHLPGPDNSPKDIKSLTINELLFLQPHESIYLLSRFIGALSRTRGVSVQAAADLATQLLAQTQYSLTKNPAAVMAKFPPVVFCSGAAHYSIKKAADLLGFGSDNVVIIKTDAHFRMDVADLEQKMKAAIHAGRYPLAVVAIGATTEEGAVDPIHEVVDLRKRFEAEGKSFWLHIDSAWGGYISTIFHLDGAEETALLLPKIAEKLGLSLYPATQIQEHIQTVIAVLQRVEKSVTDKHYSEIKHYSESLHQLSVHPQIEMVFVEQIHKLVTEFGAVIRLSDGRLLNEVLHARDLEFSLHDRIAATQEFVSEKVNISLNHQKHEKTLTWGNPSIVSAFLAYKNADSITIDPHKLGYLPYPCGVVAFRHDRVRHFLMQRAPYITSSGQNALMHTPPRHVQDVDYDKIDRNELPYDTYHIAIDAFAPFILEGSKPGAAAASLWFASKMIPLNRKHHGLMIRDSLLAARELYEWLFTWEKVYENGNISEPLLYEYKFFGAVPDTNVLVFCLKSKLDDSLAGMNRLTEAVYEKFSIQAELGAREYSYAQSFFLSKTRMDESHYAYDAFTPFFEGSSGLRNAARDYPQQGLLVLRAAVTNPYLAAMRRHTSQNLIREFVWELHKTANAAVRKMAAG